MIVQGSPEWHQMRLGKVTASRVADIVRKTKNGASATRQRYLGELVAERLTGVVADSYKSKDMEWGNETEAEARAAYAFYCGAALTQVPFVEHPSLPMCGASPDALVGDDGLVEIKCPATHTHIASLLGAPIDPDYVVQMLWQMECTGRQWCDWVSFDPRMPEEMKLHVVRVSRDEERLAELRDAVHLFLGEVSATGDKLTAQFHARAA